MVLTSTITFNSLSAGPHRRRPVEQRTPAGLGKVQHVAAQAEQQQQQPEQQQCHQQQHQPERLRVAEAVAETVRQRQRGDDTQGKWCRRLCL